MSLTIITFRYARRPESGIYAKLSIGTGVGFLLTTIVDIVMLQNFKKIAGLLQVKKEDENKRSFFKECLNVCLNAEKSNYPDDYFIEASLEEAALKTKAAAYDPKLILKKGSKIVYKIFWKGENDKMVLIKKELKVEKEPQLEVKLAKHAANLALNLKYNTLCDDWRKFDKYNLYVNEDFKTVKNNYKGPNCLKLLFGEQSSKKDDDYFDRVNVIFNTNATFSIIESGQCSLFEDIPTTRNVKFALANAMPVIQDRIDKSAKNDGTFEAKDTFVYKISLDLETDKDLVKKKKGNRGVTKRHYKFTQMVIYATSKKDCACLEQMALSDSDVFDLELGLTKSNQKLTKNSIKQDCLRFFNLIKGFFESDQVV